MTAFFQPYIGYELAWLLSTVIGILLIAQIGRAHV